MKNSTTDHEMPLARVRSGSDILELANKYFAKYGDFDLDLSRNYTERPPVEFDEHMID